MVRGFSTNVYTKDEFRSKLKNIDLSNLENYREHIKALIKDALKEDSVVEDVQLIEADETVEEAAEEIIEDITTEDMVVENAEEVKKTEDVIKTIYSRKRNYK